MSQNFIGVLHSGSAWLFESRGYGSIPYAPASLLGYDCSGSNGVSETLSLGSIPSIPAILSVTSVSVAFSVWNGGGTVRLCGGRPNL